MSDHQHQVEFEAASPSRVRRRTREHRGSTFRDPSALDIVGVYPNYAAAERAWRGKAQQTVDNAMVRYFIVHLHRFLDPA